MHRCLSRTLPLARFAQDFHPANTTSLTVYVRTGQEALLLSAQTSTLKTLATGAARGLAVFCDRLATGYAVPALASEVLV